MTRVYFDEPRVAPTGFYIPEGEVEDMKRQARAEGLKDAQGIVGAYAVEGTDRHKEWPSDTCAELSARIENKITALGDNPKYDEAKEKLGVLIDTAENLAQATQMPMPDSLHMKALRTSLPDLARNLKLAFIDITGDNPWAGGPFDPHKG